MNDTNSTSTKTWRTVRIGGIRVNLFSRQEWVQRISEACAEPRAPHRRPLFLSSVNGNVLSKYATTVKLRQAIDQSDGIDADGMPIIMASRWVASEPIPERCATTDFYYDVALEAAKSGLTFYLLGGTEDVNRAAIEASQRLHPGLRIAGGHSGYFTEQDEDEIVDAINAARPDVLWVGLGVPKEQLFVVRNLAKLEGVGVVKTCGGLFDFVSGRSLRAPMWMQDCSLEWAYRVYQDPRRLLWRYVTTNIHAVYLIVADAVATRVQRS